LGLEVAEFDADQAYQAGLLRPLTRQFGLSSGGRACLALTRSRGLPVLTADQAWEALQVDVEVRVIR
jgi:PIN domain nuclease of toxin-antitoxin system